MSDRLTQSLINLAKQAYPNVDYLALYPAKVVSQTSDGLKVDVLPDDQRLPGMTGVEIRSGIAGATQMVANGTYVLIGWQAGDPRQPYATTFSNSTSVIKLVLNAGEVDITTSGDTKITAQGSVDIEATGTATVKGTGGTNLGMGTAQVLTLGSFDCFGVPIQQNPATIASLVKAG